jgi:hypothetical protein
MSTHLETMRRELLRSQYQALRTPSAHRTAEIIQGMIMRRRGLDWRPTTFGRMRKVDPEEAGWWPLNPAEKRARLAVCHAQAANWHMAPFGRARKVTPAEAALWPCAFVPDPV